MVEARLIAGRYQLGRPIGAGGIGQVYQGVDRQTGESVALKILRADITSAAPQQVERLHREADLLRRLNHPNIVRLRATAEEADGFYIIMDYLPGGSLAELLARQAPGAHLPLAQALNIALGAADALARAHHLGVIHRDVKPGNILLAGDGTPIVSDFGLAHVQGYPPITARGDMIGTFQYLSPEACNREALDQRTDIWGLGAVVFEMLAGQPPFTADAYPGAIVRAILDDPLPDLAQVRPDLPAELSRALNDLLRRMLAKNRGARLASMRLAGAELEDLLRRVEPAGPQPAAVPAADAPAAAEPPMVLLPTKYTAPPLRPGLVRRPRLIEKLQANPHCRLILVSAPAGFGKTTLVAEWLSEAAPRRPSQGLTETAQVAWLSLDAGDNDPAQFLQYLVAALQQMDAHAGRTVQPVLQGALLRAPQQLPVPTLLAGLVGDLALVPAPFYVVLDDYHAIGSQAVHQILGFLAERLPPAGRLVVITREDPPLPLPRLRARGQVVELRERDLRFTAGETRAFLNETMSLGLADGPAATLHSRTEGWIAGLQLAALALQENAEGPEAAGLLAAAFTGQDRYVIDYLMSEVLERQPEPLAGFLVQTSILDRLTAGLCDAVTGRDDSQALLARLEQSNLFLMPLDHQRAWYRYYRLFAEFLRTRLAPAAAPALHRRAAAWYEAHGLPGEAVGHALAYGRATGDWADAVRLVRTAAEEQIQIGAAATLQAWLEPLPPDETCGDPEIATIRAWTCVMRGDFAGAEAHAAAAEACAAHGDSAGGLPPALHGRLLTVRAILAMGRRDHEAVIALAEAALAALGDAEPRWRTIALWELAEAQERTRPIEQALASLRAIRVDRPGAASPFFAPAISAFIAAALNNLGRRHEALAVCAETLAEGQAEAGGLGPLAGMVLAQQALLHWEGGELDAAQASAEAALAHAERLGFPDIVAFALGDLAMVAQARGQTAEALSLLRRARGQSRGESFGDTSWLRAYEAHIHLQRGDREAALRWAAAEGLDPASAPTYLTVDAHLVYVRLLLAQDRLPEARGVLARLAAFLDERGLRRYAIAAHLLQALAAHAAGEGAAAREAVLDALRLAVPEGYLRRFLEEDARLLAIVAAVRYVAPDFIDEVLQGAGPAGIAAEGPRPRAGPQAAPLIEPLTERELEILRLLAAGLANAEIANRLIIATGTVKRHLNNIYGKLGVESRTQAIARGQELGLL